MGHCDGIELDIHATADGEFVVHHDPTLSDGARIDDLLLREVLERRLADGAPPPRLADVLTAFPTLSIYIEAKSLPPEYDLALLALMAADPRPDRLHVHAFDHRIIARLSRIQPNGSYGVLSASYPIDPVWQALEAGAQTLWQEHHLIDAALVKACAAAGVRVIAWTVNDATSAARLRAMGVAGLCGNWPDRLGVAG